MSWQCPETCTMWTSDGVRLDADVHRPERDGTYPVLLLRQAYGRKVASTLCYAHPAWYAAQGYIVVVQDVRGRGTSEGVFEPFLHEARDGAEAIAWAASLPGSTGSVGTYGFSYQGTNQLLAATLAGSELKAMAPAMIGWDLREDWAYEGGGFNLLGNLAWGLQLGYETARRDGDAAGYAALRSAAMMPPFHSETAAWPPIARQRLANGFYRKWFDRDDPAYWDAISPASRIEELVRRDVPAAFIGGWFDTHLPGTIAGYRALARGRSRLAIGPWWHFPWDRRIAGADFGPEAVGAIDQMQVRWFDHWLKGHPLDDASAVSLFDMGANVWRDFAGWPEGAEQGLALASSGRASNDIAAGRLVSDPADPAIDMLVHDPWRPAPSVGGAYGMPSGPADRSAIDTRSDVLTYTSEPLADVLTIFGDVRVELAVKSDAASFDLACTLGRVLPDGRCQTITTGFLSPVEGSARTIAAPLRATCASILRGERLRLSIAVAAFPAHPVNPGDGSNPVTASSASADVITLAVATGRGSGSRLVVGVTGAGTMMRYWHDLTTSEFRNIGPDAVAVLPVAATEQHGPHLAVSVDADINAGVIAAAAAHVDDATPVYVLPALEIGKSNEHIGFPGTLTLSADTLARVWTEVAESAIRAGFRRLVIFNSHGGQPQIADIVVRDLRVRHDVLAVAANINGFGLPDNLFDAAELDYGIHGGAIETSMMLHLRPDRVRPDCMADFPSAGITIARDYAMLRLEGPIGIGWMTQDVHPSGAVGDARNADAARGGACVDHIARNLAILFDEVSRYPLDRLKDPTP